MEKIDRRPLLEAEIKDLHEQINLYIQSNPDYGNKSNSNQISDTEVHTRIVSAFSLLGQLRTIHSLLQTDSEFVETTDN